jgi:hypothetical protein
MSSKRWRVLSISCMYIETKPANHDPRIPFFGGITHSQDYEVQHMSVKRTREKGVRVVATRLTEAEAVAMVKLLNASKTN